MADYVVNISAKDNISGTINNVKKEIQGVGKELDGVSQSSAALEQAKARFDKITQSTAPAKKQLREIQMIMANLNLKGLSNTEEFTEMAQRAGQLKDAMSDAGEAIRAYANDEGNLKAISEGFQGIAAAGSIATGAIGLFGAENEKLSQILVKVQSAQALLNGVTTIAKLLNKDSTLMLKLKSIQLKSNTTQTNLSTAATGANTVATGANTAATVTNTAAQKAWNVAKAVGMAMFGNFTGLLLLGVAGLTAYAIATDDTTDSIKEQTEAQKNQADSQQTYTSQLANTYSQLMGSYAKLRAEWNSLSNDHQRNDWIKQNKNALAELGGEINKVADAESFFNQNTEAVVDAFRRRAKAAAYAALMTEAYKKQIEMEQKGQNMLDKYGVNAGDKYNGSFTMDQSTKYDRTQTANGGKYYSNDNGATWYYTAKGAAEYNKQLWNQNTAMRELNEAYIENTNNLRKYEEQYGELATTTKKVITNTSRGGGHTPKKKPEDDPLAGSIDAMNKELSLLKQNLRAGLIPEDKVEAAKKRMQELTEAIDAKEIELGLKVKPETKQKEVDKWANSEYNLMSKKLKEIEEQLQHDSSLTLEAKTELINEANDLQRQLDEMSNHDDLTIPAKVEPKYIVKGSYDDIKKSIQNAYSQINDIADDYDLGLIDYNTATKRIREINKQIVALGGKPYMVEIESKFGKELQSFIDGTSQFHNALSSIDGVVGAFQRLDDAIKNNEDGWTQFMAAVNATMSVIEAISTVMTILDAIQNAMNITTDASATVKAKEAAAHNINALAEDAEAGSLGALAITESAAIAPTLALATAVKKLAAAQIFQAHAEIPFVGPPAAAAGVATMEATLAAIQAFANGGIVKGSSRMGDKMLARVNAGEMILNNRQQANLFKMLEQGSEANTVQIVGGAIRIKGSDLMLALKNEKKKTDLLR